MKTLPIYPLRTHVSSLERLDQLGREMFGISDYALGHVEGRRVLRSQSTVLEMAEDTGGLWAADYAELWNPESTPQLPDPGAAEEMAARLIRQYRLFPDTDHDRLILVDKARVAASYVVTKANGSDRREEREIDRRVTYDIRLLVEHPESAAIVQVPIISGEGKLALTLGDRGRVIGYQDAWPGLDAPAIQATVIPREIADRTFRALTSALEVTAFEADLAYKRVVSRGRQYLSPVWAYRAKARIKDREMPLRVITLPATEFGPFPQPAEPQHKRVKRIRLWSALTSRRGLFAVNPFEAGASWIGEVGGLGGSAKNAQGFVDGLQNAGWNINFNWGDCNAWETDWHENDDSWVDAADFVFYTGHADGNGWMLMNPGDCRADSLDHPKVGAGPQALGDLWGRQDLEWVVVAACGPLEDEILSPGGGDVLARWDGAFDGLHILMGYGAVTFDNEDEGKRIIKYAREGQTLINAWFRTAQEIQPSTNGWEAPFGPTVWVGAMWATKSGQASPQNDHLWGHGSVAPDPRGPDGFTCMWVTT